ncbi:4-aminobutyrate aminotransferase-like enzyme [Acinetobacter sp. BIGb0196]|nr:4-aminobutyrate aminotransferase-like enzyme [Acinetobacter guillouiae]MCW2250176.1 4-aminobutyrate aminotransferase-like enzyme [Acinetobacter sp. BIGb0204]NII39280.1 4-aminobutyrate aminotransferase-like enzyme [Acinetobacter sp. BIGb0196]
MLKHDCVGGVRGTGLFIGFELVTDQVSKTPNKALALDLIEMLRVEYLVLTSTTRQCHKTASIISISSS